MPIQELTTKLKLNAFYTALMEQETQPTYSELPFQKRVQMLLEAEVLERDNNSTFAHKTQLFLSISTEYSDNL